MRDVIFSSGPAEGMPREAKKQALVEGEMNRRTRCLLVLCLLPVLFVLPQTLLAAAPAEAGPVERGVAVPMRDGVKLVADIYMPPGRGPWPVIVIRMPYNRAGGGGAAAPFRDHYVVVVQDTRGRYESGGDFRPFFPEVNDGFDTIEWAAQQ